MANYLDRYQRGDCEQVWADLLALRGGIREKPLYADALAVAKETMSRVRANIERLVPRLTSLGYRFAYPDRAFVPAGADTRRSATEAEHRFGPLPLSRRVWCNIVGEVNFMGSHPKLSVYAESPHAHDVAQNFL